MAKKEKKHKGGGRWIQELQTDDTVEEQEGTFSEDKSAEEIAIELKRKAPDFQAAMGKITLFINRAGKRIPESRLKELNRVKSLLREMYDRKDRERANKEKKRASVKYAGQWATWVDQDREKHVGDQYLELLLAEPGMVRSVHPEVKWDELQKYKKWLLDLFKKDVPHPDPENKDEEKEDFEIIKKKMSEQIRKGINVPVFEVGERGEPLRPVIVPKIASIHSANDIIFSSEDDALQYLADVVKEKLTVAANKKTFKCPECGSKVLEQTKYCVKCKKKVKQASEELIFSSEDDALQYLADITGKNIKVAE
jgi:predicted RNA-binding Zn-ribbon protein involved in translation (DUF1610 family)